MTSLRKASGGAWETPRGGGVTHLNVSSTAVRLNVAVQTGHEPANHSAHAGGAPYTHANKALARCPFVADKEDGL